MDGKGAGGGWGEPPCEPCREGKDEQGRSYWHLYALRAALTSSTACPVLGQQLLEAKKGEARAFPELLQQVVDDFDPHFLYVTADAGMTSASNAQAVREHGKHYLFALKGNFHRLYDKACVLLACAPVRARTHERARGASIEREPRVVAMPAEEDFPEARQLVRVRQRRLYRGRTTVETRYFLTSASCLQLPPRKLLALVRRHWGTESAPQAHRKEGSDEDLTDCAQAA